MSDIGPGGLPRRSIAFLGTTQTWESRDAKGVLKIPWGFRCGEAISTSQNHRGRCGLWGTNKLTDGDPNTRISTEKDAIHDGEDGGVRADTESEGEYSDGGEAGGFAHHAEGIVGVLKNASEQVAATFSQHYGLAIQITLDWLETAREEVFAFQFVGGGSESCVFALASCEEFVVAILKVLRDLFGNFPFARRGEFQRSKAAENFRLPFKHFLPR
jgi:hypothetical protein